jgi:DNA polymerase-1
MENKPKFILIDGHSLAFRSYYAFAKSRDGGLRTSMGIPTSICFGFLKSLLEVMSAEKPQYIAIAFDLKTPTFRHEADVNYKADRAETPEDFIPDIENLQELLTALNLPIVTAPGYEADDVLGTLSQKASNAGYQVKILSGDRDLFQLVDDQKEISVLYLNRDAIGRSRNGKSQEFHQTEVLEKLGVPPHKIVDYKALCGDKSDNIPGVRGIGEKTAVQLLTTYNSLEEIYQSLNQIKDATQKKLVEGKNDAYHSQHLARIVIDVPLDIELETCELTGFDESQLIPLLETLELKTFITKVKEIQQQFGGKVITEKPETTKEESDSEIVIEDDSFFSFTETLAARKILEAALDSPIKPHIIQTLGQLNELIETHLKTNTPVAWDTETTAIEPRDAELVGIGCCWGNGESDMAYIPLNHKKGINLDKNAALQALKPILESAEYPKIFHNTKFDRLIFLTQGIGLKGVVLDTMLASYVLDPEGAHSLKDLAKQLLNISGKTYKETVPKGQTIADVNIQLVAHYCGMDAYATFKLAEFFQPELDEIPTLKTLLLEIEQPLELVLGEMEYRGIRIDTVYLQELSDKLKIDLEVSEKQVQVYELPGKTVNLNSPKQLSQLLFDTLKLDTKKSRKIKTGYSTDAAVLEKLQGDHPVIDAILENRTLSKLKSTYVDALPLLVRQDTKRVHTDFNQTATGTGRLSSSQPNLQNIPIRTEFSRQIRKAFLPEEGWLMVSADYSQIELRILAHLSEEPVLLEAYHNNEDVHTVTAKLLFEKDIITPDERRLGKTINFGVIYGMGAQKFARSVGVTPAEGKKFIDRFYQKYSKVFEYLETVKKHAIALGYVSTIKGRRRYFQFESDRVRKLQESQKDPANIHLEDFKNIGKNDAQILRAAANAPIQGSSADIIKIAMIELHQTLQNYQARLLLQVHDELVLEVPPEEWEELQPKIKNIMENAVTLKVPLVVDIHAGQNWMETK